MIKKSQLVTLSAVVMNTGLSGTIFLLLVAMQIDTDHLIVSDSGIPGAGKGLFTSLPIPKGTPVIEYTGEITTWDKVKHDANNKYIYFVNEQHVIDAKRMTKAIARYANDAQGFTKVKGMQNNSNFVNINGKVFIKATSNIPAGSEILVDYGKDYWDTVRRNESMKSNQKNGKTSI